MSRRKSLLFLLCVTLMISLTGCPMEETIVEGAWQMDWYVSCGPSSFLHPGMVLYSDGSAELYNGEVLVGTWSLSGTTITIAIVIPESYTFTGEVSSDGTMITDGEFSGDLEGCWTADKLEF